jgi:membrane fusion protein (multidrug efflux system)
MGKTISPAGRLRRLAASFALAAAACEPTSPEDPAPTHALAVEPVVEVETARVRRGSIVQRIAAPGSLLARRESRIGAEVGGRILRIHVQEGDRVAAGAPLFEVDREPYELAMRQARARLDRAAAERKQLESNLARGLELRRSEILSAQDLDQLETSLDVARAAEREAAEAVALAERNLSETLVRAPYEGSIAARLEDEGSTALVQPQTIVIVLQETAELEAQAAISEVHFSAIRSGDVALLHVEGLPKPIATEVSSVSDTIDPATRTFLVRMRVPNPERRLKAGIFARVEILPRAKSEVLLVAREAVRREDGRTTVLVVRDGRAVAVAVGLGDVSEETVEIVHGLRVDEEIVVGEGARRLGPGMRVRVEKGQAGPS